MGRLERLRALADALEPTVLDIQARSEHGLQGASGLIGQYRAALKEIEDLEALEPTQGTVLDELAKRRGSQPTKPAAGSGRAAGGNK